MTQHQGNYIVIEGIDGTGKSTQVELLAKHYRAQGHSVTVIEEPSSDDSAQTTPIAHYLRTVIKMAISVATQRLISHYLVLHGASYGSRLFNQRWSGAKLS